jgi:hypothetical protein
MKRLVTMVSVMVALAAASTVLAAATPNGTYKTKIGAAPLGGTIKGTWTIKFEKPHYTVTDNGMAVIHGTYALSGTRITFTDKSGPAACPGSGAYSFTLKGSMLTFTRIRDSATKCPGREAVLAGRFTKTT